MTILYKKSFNGPNLDSPGYVALGLSTNGRMGDDSVMECVPEGGTARAHTSYTVGNPNYGVSRENVVSTKQSNRKQNTVLSSLGRKF